MASWTKIMLSMSWLLEKKGSLVFENQIGNKGFNPIGQNFGDNLITGIAKGYGSEMVKIGRLGFLGYKGKVSRVGVST